LKSLRIQMMVSVGMEKENLLNIKTKLFLIRLKLLERFIILVKIVY